MRRLHGKRVYLDTNIFIYALEAFEEYVAIVAEVFQAIDSGKMTAVTSLLTLGECLVRPFRDERRDIVDAYTSMLQGAVNFEVTEINRDVMVSAAELRAQKAAVSMPDAIHLATARQHECDAFLTNDQRLAGASTPELTVILLGNVIPDGR